MGLFYNLKKSFVRNVVDFSLNNLPDSVGTSFPLTPVVGQTFYRTGPQILYKWNGTSWDTIDIDYYFVDLDSHAAEQELPPQHFAAVRNFSLRVDEHTVWVDALIGIGIFNDSNLIKHDAMLDKLLDAYLPTKTQPIYDAANGNIIGEFKSTNNLELFPMFKADQRPVQFIGVTLASNITANLNSP